MMLLPENDHKKIGNKDETKLSCNTKNLTKVTTQDSLQVQKGRGRNVLKFNNYYFFNGANKYRVH